MIVDDNDGMRGIIRSIVQLEADEVLECNTGTNASIAYSLFNPDCVFMDIQMKGLDGIQATKHIRSHHPDAKIIIVSNYNDERSREAAHEAGASGYVHKDNLLALRPELDRLCQLAQTSMS